MSDLSSLLEQLSQSGDPFAPSDADRKAALKQALFAAGAAMLANNRSKNPFPAIGSGGLAGLGVYNNQLAGSSDQKKQGLLFRQQLAQLMRQEKEYGRQDASREALNQARQAATTAPGSMPVTVPGEFGGENGATTTEQVPTPGGFDANKFSELVMQNPNVDIGQALALRASLAKQNGWRKVGVAPGGGDLYVGPDGKPEVIGKAGEQWIPVREMDGGILMREVNTGKTDWVGMKGTKVTANAYGGAGGKVSEGLDKGTADYVYKDIMPAANAARTQNQTLKAMLPRINTTGFFAPENKTFQSMLTAFGLGGEKAKLYAANAEAFQGDAMRIVLEEQQKQKGPQTDKDFARIQDSMPQMRNSPLGNEAIIRMRIAQNNRLSRQMEFMGKLMMNRERPMNALEAQLAWEQSPEGQASIFEDPILSNFSLTPRAAGGKITPAGSARVGGVTVTPVQ